jgi:hypothetical protein
MPLEYESYLKLAYFLGYLCSDIVKGLIGAGIVWLIAWLIGRFRIKNPVKQLFGSELLRIGWAAE